MGRISLRRTPRVVLLGMLILLAGVLWLGQVELVSAELSGTKSCTGPDGGSSASTGDLVTCTLTITAETEPPADLPIG